MRCTIENLTGQPSRALTVIAEGEGRFAGVRIVEDATPPIETWMTRFERWVGVIFERPVAPGASVTLEILREPGGTERSWRGGFRGADPVVPRMPFIQPPPDSTSARDARSMRLVFAEAPAEARTLLRRLEVLSLDGALDPERGRRALAMWWLDSQTHPRLLLDRGPQLSWPAPIGTDEARYRTACIAALSTELGMRAGRRQRLAREGTVDAAAFAAAMRPLRVTRTALAYIAELLRRGFSALDPTLAAPAGEDFDVSVDRIADAIGDFAAGDLWLECHLGGEAAADPRLSECAPDGPFFFLFAELAMVAARMGLHGDFWLRALPGFVAAQRSYRYAYGDPEAAISRDELLRAANHPPKRFVPEAERVAELQRVRRLSLDELEVLMGQNIHATLRDAFAG